jgi:hypothetical protein
MRIPAWGGGAGDSSCTTAGAVWDASRDGIGVRRGWHIRWDTGTRPGWFAAAESLHALRKAMMINPPRTLIRGRCSSLGKGHVPGGQHQLEAETGKTTARNTSIVKIKQSPKQFSIACNQGVRCIPSNVRLSGGRGLIIMAECDLLPEGVQKDAASPSSLAGCSALRQTTYTYLPARVLGKFRSAKSREQN